MTPLTKETIEAASSTSESAAPRPAAPTPSSTHLRSDAVSLEIPVKVHGSRITEVVLGVTPHTEPFEEQSTTMIVFAQGGVVKMSTPVTNGQMMVLTNLKTRQDVICRVVKVRNNPNLQAYVEIEFTHPQPGYWGVFFPSDGPEFAPKTASPAQSLHLEPETKEKSGQGASRLFASAPNLPGGSSAKLPVTVAPQSHSPAAKSSAPSSYTAPPAKPESAFISIGSQEEVQVAATSTLSAKKAPALEIVKDHRAVNLPANAPSNAPGNVSDNVPKTVPNIAPNNNTAGDFAEAPVASAAPVSEGLSIAELQGDTESPSVISAGVAGAVESQPQSSGSAESSTSSRSLFGTFGGGSAAGSSREIFGSSLGVAGATDSANGTEPRKNWILIAACGAIAAVAAAGGTMYFYRAPSGSPPVTAATVSAPTPAVTSAPNTSQNIAPQGSQSSQSSFAAPAASAISEASPASANTRANNTKASKAIVTDHTDHTETSVSSARSAPAAPGAAAMMAATLSAHPVASRRTDANQTDAPALDAGVTPPDLGSALPGVSASSNVPPPPPSAPARVGGELKAPKLISTTPPVYPVAAKQALVDGDVVIHAVIDKSGNVSEADVISGPPMLREAAIAAVRRWKYAPSLLDGQPVSVDTTVTLKFRR